MQAGHNQMNVQQPKRGGMQGPRRGTQRAVRQLTHPPRGALNLTPQQRGSGMFVSSQPQRGKPQAKHHGENASGLRGGGGGGGGGGGRGAGRKQTRTQMEAMTAIPPTNINVPPPPLPINLSKPFPPPSKKIQQKVQEKEKPSEPLRCLLDDSRDCNSRLRTAAVQGLRQWFEGGQVLPKDHYKQIAKLCVNSEKNVRLEALRLLVLFANQYPDEKIRNERGVTLTIQDDAFAITCRAINDLVTAVRVEAARLLGEYRFVSERFLFQTLDKTLQRKMKAGIDDRGVQNRGGWNSRKRMGEDVLMERDEEEADSLIPTDACGAFITALEDEFQAVREAAISSLGKLATNCINRIDPHKDMPILLNSRTEFAKLCIDNLADMFNDEIQSVRLDAIVTLTPLASYGTLKEDQLNTILSVLDDAAYENRIAVHELLAKTQLIDAKCVERAYTCLLKSYRRFPGDKKSIYRCLSGIGFKHPEFVHGQVNALLGIHPIFHTREHNIEDAEYLGKLILLLNAASKVSVICSMIPAYVKKHYRFLRVAQPDLIPVVKELEEKRVVPTKLDGPELDNLMPKVGALLDNVYTRIVGAQESQEFRDKAPLFRMINRDLSAFQKVDEESLSVPASLLFCLCKAVNLYENCLHTPMNNETFEKHADDCMHAIHWIEDQYSGLDTEMRVFLKEFSLRMRTLVAIKLGTIDDEKNAALLEELRVEIGEARRQILAISGVDFCGPLSAFLMCIGWNLQLLSSKTPKQGTEKLPTSGQLQLQMLDELRKASRSMMPSKFGNLENVVMKSVKVISPTKDMQAEDTVRFVVGMPVGVNVTCLLSNLSEWELQNFRIQARYPDETLSMHRPRPRDFHRLDEKTVRLETTVLLSSPTVWEDSADVSLTCGIQIPSTALDSTTNQRFDLSTGEGGGKTRFAALPDADNRVNVSPITMGIHPMNRA